MRKQKAKVAVGQLVLQIVFPQEKTSHTAEETQDNGPRASSAPAPPRNQTPRQGKWYSLYDKVFALSNLEAAWQKVQANGGAPGIDRISIARFGKDVTARLQHLETDLRRKTYRGTPGVYPQKRRRAKTAGYPHRSGPHRATSSVAGDGTDI